jgi:hypothetical protein
MILFPQRASVPSDVLMREVAGDSVILNLNTETYFGLDEVGTRMWLALTESETIQHAYESLLDEYDVDPDTLSNDLTKLIEDLVSHGLLELSAP